MTAQACEKLIYEGDEHDMHTTPDLPEDQSVVEHVGNDFLSSACWRGYVGTWEIKDNEFYLLSLAGNYRLKSDNPVFASWYTGDLVLPKGEPVNYFHGGFGGVYEKNIVISIVCGYVLNKKYFRRDTDSSLYMNFCPGFNRLMGRLVVESNDVWLAPDPFDTHKIVLYFRFDGFIAFEMNSGRIASYLKRLPNGVSVKFEEPQVSLSGDRSYYLILVSLGAAWGKEISDFFDIDARDSSDKAVANNKFGWISPFSRSRLASSFSVEKGGDAESFNASDPPDFDDYDDEIPF